MSEEQIFAVPQAIADKALVDDAQYKKMYQASLDDPDAFWAEHGRRLAWRTTYTKVKNTHYGKDDVSIKWYEDGTLNACVNCVDRHCPKRPTKRRLFGKAMNPAMTPKSPIGNCMKKSANLPMC